MQPHGGRCSFSLSFFFMVPFSDEFSLELKLNQAPSEKITSFRFRCPCTYSAFVQVRLSKKKSFMII